MKDIANDCKSDERLIQARMNDKWKNELTKEEEIKPNFTSFHKIC